MKLTSKQQQALRHMKQEIVQKHRFGYRDWRITGPAHPSVVGRVISLGLARWAEAPNTSDAQIAVLTDAGRTAIALTSTRNLCSGIVSGQPRSEGKLIAELEAEAKSLSRVVEILAPTKPTNL